MAMKLIYNEQNKNHLAIADRMKSMVLAFERIPKEDLDEISLEDGDISYVGEKQVNEHLDVINGELHKWYYGSC